MLLKNGVRYDSIVAFLKKSAFHEKPGRTKSDVALSEETETIIEHSNQLARTLGADSVTKEIFVVSLLTVKPRMFTSYFENQSISLPQQHEILHQLRKLLKKSIRRPSQEL